MTMTECDWCEGTGQRFDPTDAQTRSMPAYLAAEREAARPECDPAAEIPSWMLEF